MKTLYILLASIFFSCLTGSTFAQGSGSETCITAGDAQPQNISYKVNNKKVGTLQGNVREGQIVEVSFTIPAGSSPTWVSLVSYTTPEAYTAYSKGDQYEVHDYETMQVGPGHYSFEVTVPKHFFEVDFAMGCVIWNVSTDRNYAAQNRMLNRATGGTNPCHGGHRKVQVCHVPKGNPANAHTVTISEAAAKAHVGRHGGDYYGPCRTGQDTGKTVTVDVTCETVTASSNVNISTITLLLDDSSTQEFTINAKTARTC